MNKVQNIQQDIHNNIFTDQISSVSRNAKARDICNWAKVGRFMSQSALH